MQAYRQGYIGKASLAAEVNNELDKLRISCGTVISYDWVSLPLVYTQVVTLAVYTFFGTTLLGRQWLDPNTQIEGYLSKNIDYVIPIFTILQFVFYIGWLKVAEALLNPYGEDDEDFDTSKTFLCDFLEKSNFCPKIQFWQNPNIFTSFSPKFFFDNFSREIKVANS